MEKVTEAIKLHLPESMLRDVQDCAMSDDRKVSEWIRHVLSLHLYGIKRMQDETANQRGDEGRES